MKRQIVLATQFATSRVACHDIWALCPHPASIAPTVRSRQRRADIAPSRRPFSIIGSQLKCRRDVIACQSERNTQ